MTPPVGGPRGGATATAATPGFSTSTLVLRQGLGGRGTDVAGDAPNPSAHSTVSTTPSRVTVEPPTGGDSSALTRSASPRVAPAPILAAVKVAVLAAVFFGIHAAAAHPVPALLLAAALIAVNILAARRSHHA